MQSDPLTMPDHEGVKRLDFPLRNRPANLKWSQKTGQRAKVYPEPLKGYENGEAPEVHRPI